MKIDRKLNLVIPIEREDGTKLWVHSTPVLKPTFEMYYLVLAKTFSAFAQNGLDPRSAPSVAALIMKDVARTTGRGDTNWWEGDDGIGGKAGLLAEMVRLSNCLVSTPDSGFQQIPLQSALDNKTITDEDKTEVMNQLVFFTVASLVAPKEDRPILIHGMASIYNLDCTSLNFTEWAASFKIQMQKENIGEKEKA